MTTKFLSTLGLLLAVQLSSLAQFAETEYLTPLFPDITISYAIDAEGDGDADVLMASSSVHELGVVSQTTPGVHHGLVRVPVMNFPVTDFGEGDFNGDGLKEVVLYSDTLKQLTCLANPLGQYQEYVIADSLEAMIHWQFFDYNNDGKTDFIYSTTESIFISYAQADWQFAAPVVLLDPPNEFFSFIVGDTDTDTDYDITVGETNQFRVYVRNSQGVYNPGTPLVTAGNPVRLFLKNVFATNHPEVFYVTTGFFWSLNNTSNTFQGNNLIGGSVLNGECSFMSTDMDDDGDQDLMLSMRTSSYAGLVKYYENINSGFTSGTYDFAQTYGGRMQGLDMNNDGRMDFFNQNPYPGAYSNYFYYLRGSVPFVISEGIARNPIYPNHIVSEAAAITSSSLAFGDVDNDGDEDMVVASRYKIVWYPNDGSGHFVDAPLLIRQIGPINSGTIINLKDFDNDGDLDITYSSISMANDGIGNFTTATFTLPPAPWPCDINNDGFTDYISVTNTQFRTYYGTAGGTFLGPYSYNHNYGTLIIHSAIWGDFDGNGTKNEVFFNAQSAGNELGIRLRMNGYPNSFYANTMSSCFAARAFIVGDFDGDDDHDFKCIYFPNWTRTGLSNPPPFDVDTEEYNFLFDYPGERSYYLDVDHDGNFDYFCKMGAQVTSSSIVWIELNLNNMDQTHAVYNENEELAQVYAFHDLDQDGDEEMIFTCKNGSVGIRENLYNNNFTHSLFIKAFVDANENGVWDNNESTAEGVPIQVGSAGNDVYVMTGDYLHVPRAVGAYQTHMTSLANSPYESLGIEEIAGVLSSSNLEDTLFFPVRMLGAEMEAVANASIQPCSFSADLHLGFSNGNTAVSGATGLLSWSSCVVPGDWSASPFVTNGNNAEWSFGSVAAYQDSLQTINFTWASDAVMDSLYARWTLRDEAGNVLSETFINLGVACDPQATFEVHSLNGQGSEFFIGPESGVTYQYTFNAISGVPTDVVIQLDLANGVITDQMQVVSSNYPITLTNNASQGWLVSINNYLNETASLDSAWVLTLHFPIDTTVITGGVIYHEAQVYLDNNAPIIDSTFHTLYNCSEILDAFLNETVICRGEAIEIFDTANDNETYTWQLGDVIYAGAEEGYLYPDNETTFLIVTTSNAFCQASDTLTWEYFPINQVELIFLQEDSLLTATAGFSVYNWQLENNDLTLTSENQLLIDTEGVYSVVVTDTNGCTSQSNAITAILNCQEGDFNCDGVVNIIDVQALIASIGCENTCTEFDFDGNGLITVADLMILFTYYNP
jgi:hypothetical protein